MATRRTSGHRGLRGTEAAVSFSSTRASRLLRVVVLAGLQALQFFLEGEPALFGLGQLLTKGALVAEQRLQSVLVLGQAQSRIKALERMGELPAARVTTPFSFTLEAAERSSDPLVSLQDATLESGDQAILQRTSLTLHPGSRIGLLGANGAGKSTLIKALAGELKPVAGRRAAA